MIETIAERDELTTAPLSRHLDDLRRTVAIGITAWLIALIIIGYYYQPLLEWVIAPYREAFSHEAQEEGVAIGDIALKEWRNRGKVPLFRKSTAAPLALGGGAEKREDGYWLPPGGFLLLAEQAPPPKPLLLAPSEGISAAIKICCWGALLFSAPIWAYHLFRFLAPALAPLQRHQIATATLFSFAGCLIGVEMAYNITLPAANRYLFSFNAEIGQNAWQLERYIDYALLLLLGHGWAGIAAALFLFFLHEGFVTSRALIPYRRQVFITCFIIGALLTPPDILSQLLLAVPLYLLFELCLIYGRWRQRI